MWSEEETHQLQLVGYIYRFKKVIKKSELHMAIVMTLLS